MSGKYQKKYNEGNHFTKFETLETKLENGSNFKEQHGLSCKHATL